jgi:hypothetical protein
MKSVGPFKVSDEELRLVKMLARKKGTSEAAILRLAVWCYVLPFVPSLPPPPIPPAKQVPTLAENYRRKGGRNTTSQITTRPPPPAAIRGK